MKRFFILALCAALSVSPVLAGSMTLLGAGKPAAGGGSPTQVRVTFQASAGAAFTLDHASIGLPAGAGNAYDTAATPVELKFSGVSGFSIAANATITSDWASLSSVSSSTGTVYSRTLTSSDAGWNGYSMRNVLGPITGGTTVIIIMDMNSAAATIRMVASSSPDQTYYKSATASYNVAATSGFTGYTIATWAVTLIETQ